MVLCKVRLFNNFKNLKNKGRHNGDLIMAFLHNAHYIKNKKKSKTDNATLFLVEKGYNKPMVENVLAKTFNINLIHFDNLRKLAKNDRRVPKILRFLIHDHESECHRNMRLRDFVPDGNECRDTGWLLMNPIVDIVHDFFIVRIQETCSVDSKY